MEQLKASVLWLIMEYRERLVSRCIQVAQWFWQACLTFNPYALWTSDHIWERWMLWYCALRSRLKANSGERQRLLDWVRSKIDQVRSPNNLTSDWRDGVLMCALVEALVPGSCPRHDLLNPENALSNSQLAINLIGRHFAIKPSLTAKELVEMEPNTETNVMVLLAQLKLASAKSMLRKTLTMPVIQSQDNTQDNFLNSEQECVAKGMGLVLAVKGRKASFNIFFKSTCNLNIVIEIRGPGNSLCSERITNRSPKRKTPIKVSVVAALNCFDRASRLSRSNSSISTIGDSEENEQHTVKIPFEYEVLSGKVHVGYIPVSTGKHRLSIIWQGQHIMGSPYIVTVDESGETQLDIKPKPPRRHSLTLRRSDSADITPNSPLIQNASCDVEPLSTGSGLTGKRTLSSESLRTSGRTSTPGTVMRRRILRHIVKVDGKDVVIEDSSPEDFALAVQALKQNEITPSKKHLNRQYSLDSKRNRGREYPINWYFPIDEVDGELQSTIEDTKVQRWVEFNEGVTGDTMLPVGRERATSAPENLLWGEAISSERMESKSRCINEFPSLPNGKSYRFTPVPSETQQQQSNENILSSAFWPASKNSLELQRSGVDNRKSVNKQNQREFEELNARIFESYITESSTEKDNNFIPEKQEQHLDYSGKTELECKSSLKLQENTGYPYQERSKKDDEIMTEINNLENQKFEPSEGNSNENNLQIFLTGDYKQGQLIAKVMEERRHVDTFIPFCSEPVDAYENVQSTKGMHSSNKPEQKGYGINTTDIHRSMKNNSSSFIEECPENESESKDQEKEHIYCSPVSNPTDLQKSNLEEEDEWLVVSVDKENKHIIELDSNPHTDTETSNHAFISVGSRRQFFEKMSTGISSSDIFLKRKANRKNFNFSQTNSVDSSPTCPPGNLNTRSHSCESVRQLIPGYENSFFSRAKEFWEKGKNSEPILKEEPAENELKSESKKSIQDKMMFWQSLADSPQKSQCLTSRDEKVYTRSASSEQHEQDGSETRQVASVAFNPLGRKNIQDFHTEDSKRLHRLLISPASDGTIDSGVFEDHSISFQEQEAECKSMESQPITLHQGMTDIAHGEPVTIIFRQNPLFSLGTIPGTHSSFVDESSATGTSATGCTDDKGFIDDDIPDYASLFMDRYVSFTGLLENDRRLSRKELLGIVSEMETDRMPFLPDPFYEVDSSALLPRVGLCRAYGSGVYYGQLGTMNHFQVCTRDAGKGYLTVSMQGPGQHDVNEIVVSYAGDYLYEIMYDVAEPGYYIISVKWADWNIPNSPFICKVTF